MSSLIEQAILDAKELKEAAIKNAEQLIIEKYAEEIKNNLEQLLEQDAAPLGGLDAGLGAMPAAPGIPGAVTPAAPPVDPAKAKQDKDKIPTQLEYAAFDGLTVGKTKYPELNEEVEIDLTSLSEYELDQTKGPTKRNIKESFEVSEEALKEMLSDLSSHGTSYTHDEDELDEEVLLNGQQDEKDDDEENELDEVVNLDFNEHYIAGRDYGLGANTQEDNHTLMLSQMKDELQEKEQENKSLKQKNESLKKKLAQAQKLLGEAQKQHSSIKESFQSMKGKLSEVQLINAKLLYSNKVLSDASLNERQKYKIVESLTNAESLEKVKIVYETLQSAVEDSTSVKAPKSLSEAVSRRSSPMLLKAARREDDMDANPVNQTLSRMKILAGINK